MTYLPSGRRAVEAMPVQRMDPSHPVAVSQQISAAIRRHKLLVAATILASVALGILYTLRAKPVYEAVATMRVEVQHVELPQLVETPRSDNLISTELEVLRGRGAAEAVIDSLRLRAHLVSPNTITLGEAFPLFHLHPSADSVTLVIRPTGARAFTISRPGLFEMATVVSQLGDTTTVAGITFSLAPAARAAAKIVVRVDTKDQAVRRFQSAVRVSRPARDVDLIAIRSRSEDPSTAAASANLLARNMIAQRENLRHGRTGSASEFLEKQANTLRLQLRAAEDRLRAYQERAHVVNTPEMSRSQVSRLAGLQAELATTRAERDAFAKLTQQLRADTNATMSDGQSSSRRMLAFPSLLRNQSASVLLGALAQLEKERSELLIRRLPSDSDVQVLTGRIRSLETQLQGIADTYQQGLTNQVTALNNEAQGFAREIDSLPKKELESARLLRDAKVLSDLWVLVQTRLKEAQIGDAVSDGTITIVDTATASGVPVSPRPAVNVTLSVLAGCLLALVVVTGRELSNRSVRSRADAADAAGLPVLAVMPKTRRPGLALPWKHGKSPMAIGKNGEVSETAPTTALDRKRVGTAANIASLLVTQSGASAPYRESFHQLFANVALAYRTDPLKVVVFTSALPSEGKSLSAINFALTGAARGLRILLIDADLRCGVVGTVFHCRREPGFAELLSSARFLANAIARDGTGAIQETLWRIPLSDGAQLTVMPSGARPKEPGRLLTLDRIQDIVSALAMHFDFVVIDTPPVNLLADASLVASAADAVLLVVRAGHTEAADLHYAMDRLSAASAPVIGTVLNDIDLERNSKDDGAYRYIAAASAYSVQ